MMHSNTINEPNTFEQELTHPLIPVCWLLFIFACHLFEATPQWGGGPGREATLCRLPLPPALTLPDSFPSFAFQGRTILKGTFCLSTYETVLSSCQCKMASFWELGVNWQRLHGGEYIWHCRCLSLRKREKIESWKPGAEQCILLV